MLLENLEALIAEYSYNGNFECDGATIFGKLFEMFNEYVAERESKKRPMKALDMLDYMEGISRCCLNNIKEFDMPYINSES